MENLSLETILSGATAIVTIASIIVKITPDQNDNKIVDGILNFLNILAINNKKRGE